MYVSFCSLSLTICASTEIHTDKCSYYLMLVYEVGVKPQRFTDTLLLIHSRANVFLAIIYCTCTVCASKRISCLWHYKHYLSIYPFVHKQLIQTLFEAHIAVHYITIRNIDKACSGCRIWILHWCKRLHLNDDCEMSPRMPLFVFLVQYSRYLREFE